MKYSQFNSVVFVDNRYALYNSFEQKAIFLDEQLKDILLAAKSEGIDNLQDVHRGFYNYLVDQQFVVADEMNEVEKVRELSKQVDNNTDSFLLTINPTMNCNFKCWYCYETHVKDSRLDEMMVEKVNRFITKTVARPGLKYFSLSFFGGEPLLYFNRNVVPIIDCFTEKCRDIQTTFHVSFTTNGYLINDEIIGYFQRKNLLPSFQITLDGYREEHDLVRFVSAKKGSYTEIINSVRLLITNGFMVRLRINYTSKNIGNTHKIAEEFNDISLEIRQQYLMIDYHRVWQDEQVDDTFSVVEDNVQSLRDNGYKVAARSPNNVKDSCYADKRNSAVINYNGDIFKCTARDFTKEKRAGYLTDEGDLVWEDDYLERRMNVKFNNKPCLSCRLLPICNGGCSQHALEALGVKEYCVYFGDENEKDKVVKSKVEEILAQLEAVTDAA